MSVDRQYRYTGIRRGRHAATLLLAIYLIACVACSEGRRQQVDTESTSPDVAGSERKANSESITRTQINGMTFYRMPVGDRVFLFPPEMQTPGMSPTAFTLFLSWPGLRALKGYGQADLKHFIHLVVGGDTDPIPGFGKNNVESWLKGTNVTGPTLNDTLGLIEYRRITPSWSWYLSPDANYVGPDGQRPYVMCNPTPSKYWANTRQCRVDQFLSTQISYDYTFSDELLPEWPRIDAQIRNLLLSMTEKKD